MGVPSAITARSLTKRYGDVTAVNDLSFQVRRGDIFGLLGPNGAGKTTTLRMLMGLIPPTSGSIQVLGEAVSHAVRQRIGYLPEERGLYRNVPVLDGLVYLARLKGVDKATAQRRASDGLERLDLGHVAVKPLKTLSRGMAQKVQILATLLHEPDLVIVDEPFSGLDPVNTRALRDLLLEQHARGATIVMSAHQMNRVEELCDRVLLIRAGQRVLYGELTEIRRRFAGGTVLVDTDADLAGLTSVARVQPGRDAIEVVLAPDATPNDLFAALAASGEPVRRFQVHVPTLEEIFLTVVQGGGPSVEGTELMAAEPA